MVTMATTQEVDSRHFTIVSLTNTHGRCSVGQLAAEFGVTPETIRRDLKTLESKGLLKRVHGGAVAGSPHTVSSYLAHDEDEAMPTYLTQRVKLSIAQTAMSLIPGPLSSIFIDAGSTMEVLASTLARNYLGQNWHVVTNSPNVARILGTTGLREITVLGGTVRPRSQAVVGPSVVQSLKSMRADIAFVGTTGVSRQRGLTTNDPREAAVKHAMIEQARYVVTLCDSSKLDKEAPISFASLDDIDVIVTDRTVGRRFTHSFTGHNTRIVAS